MGSCNVEQLHPLIEPGWQSSPQFVERSCAVHRQTSLYLWLTGSTHHMNILPEVQHLIRVLAIDLAIPVLFSDLYCLLASLTR